MATASMALQVNTPQEMESMIQGYIAQGFNIANRTPTGVTLIKRKEFSILWLVIGLILCVVPLLIYLIIYASQSDQMVTITLAGAQPATGYGTQAIASPAVAASNPGYQLSPDGQYFWDGQQWRPVAQLPAQTGPLPSQSGPLYGQSGPLTDQPPAGYEQPSQQPQQVDPSAGYYAQPQPEQQPYQQQQSGPNQEQPGQSGEQPGQQSGPLYGQGQGNYPTYPGSGSGGSGQ